MDAKRIKKPGDIETYHDRNDSFVGAYCPIIGGKCKKIQCALWLSDSMMCAITGIAGALLVYMPEYRPARKGGCGGEYRK